jgi:hypothetical protein
MLNMKRFSKKISLKTFCEKLNTQEKGIQDYTPLDLKNFFNQAETNIQNGIYSINSIPNDNYFGKVPLYIVPQTSIKNMKISGLGSIALSSTLTYLAYSQFIFTNWAFLPFFGFLTIMSAARYYASRNGLDRFITSICLLDESKVRINLLSGKTLDTNLKNIHITSKFNDQLNSLNDSKGKAKRDAAGTENKNVNRILMIPINIDTITYTIMLKNVRMGKQRLTEDDLAFIDTKLLFGILNKKTKKLSLKEN